MYSDHREQPIDPRQLVRLQTQYRCDGSRREQEEQAEEDLNNADSTERETELMHDGSLQEVIWFRDCKDQRGSVAKE